MIEYIPQHLVHDTSIAVGWGLMYCEVVAAAVLDWRDWVLLVVPGQPLIGLRKGVIILAGAWMCVEAINFRRRSAGYHVVIYGRKITS